MYNSVFKYNKKKLFINAKILITIDRKWRFIFSTILAFYIKTGGSPTDICNVHKFIIIESTHVRNKYC
jgi:hypothetical protein